MLREFRPQVFLGVVQRVLHQGRIGLLQFGAEQVEVRLDGNRCGGRHDGISCAAEGLTTVSTKVRVANQVSRHACSTSRPRGVMR